MLRTVFIAIHLFLLSLFFSSQVIAAISYTYDVTGNLQSDGQYCYTYNDANQIKAVRSCGSGQLLAEYVYDYEGKRIAKKEYRNGSLYQTIYTPDREYETKKLADNTTQNTAYYYANDELVARKNPDGSRIFYHNDHLSSTSVLTDDSGNFVEETQYFPYGEIRSGGTESKYLYTGKEKDPETNLSYYGARYYDAHTRRFTQPDSILPDPYDPQQLNRYAYTRNNPLKYTDPSGNMIQVPAVLGLYAYALISNPDLMWDMQNISMSSGQFLQSPNLTSGAQVAADAASLLIPGGSVGPAARVVTRNVNEIKTGTQTLAGTIGKSGGKIAEAAKKNAVDIVTKSSFHGNDLRNTALTVGYTLRDKTTDSILKFGETINPEKRYSQKWLDTMSYVFRKEETGSKLEMHYWQHDQILKYIKDFGKRPQLNKSNW